MNELEQLALRVEQASADQQAEMLEAAFVAIHGPKPERVHGGSQEWLDWLDLHNPFVRLLRERGFLDAAMTLVPEGWRLRQANFSAPCADDRKWHLNLHGGREGEDCFVGRGSSHALALTAAALRAIASTQGGSQHG